MKLTNIILVSIISIFLLNSCDKLPTFSGNLSSEKDSLSYSIGVSFGSHLANNDLNEIDYGILIAAMEKTINQDSTLELDVQEANNYIRDYLNKKQNELSQKYLEEGQKFLEENKNKEGIVTLPSGLQYKVMKEGDGPTPKLTDKVTCYYKGTLIDGTVFDETPEDKPRSFGVNQVIPGWTEALQLMKVGSKWQLFVPTELGYGTRIRRGGKIKPNMALIFEIELLSIEEQQDSLQK